MGSPQEFGKWLPRRKREIPLGKNISSMASKPINIRAGLEPVLSHTEKIVLQLIFLRIFK